MRAFDLCCEAAGLDPQKMDIWGVHNWHSNLMAVLSVGLPKLMSHEQLMAVVAERLPNYSQTADCRSLIDYFYENYTADKGFMSAALRNINAQAQRESLATMQESDEQDDMDFAELSLGDGTCHLETPMTNKAIGEWFDSLEERFNDGLLTEAEADLSHRCGEFMLRAAIPLIALYGKETKEIVDFARWVGETAHYTMCHIFGHRVQNDINASNRLLAERLDGRKTAEPLLDQLAEVFTVQEFKAQREKNGQSTDVRMILSRYCKNGKIVKVARGVYKRLNK